MSQAIRRAFITLLLLMLSACLLFGCSEVDTNLATPTDATTTTITQTTTNASAATTTTTTTAVATTTTTTTTTTLTTTQTTTTIITTTVETTVVTTTTHTHVFAPADCSSPQTCTACGETEGESLGHSWEDATCTSPKTCSVCGETIGDPASHTYSDGTCLVCGHTNPDYTSEKLVWIPTNGGKKYHSKSSCSGMIDPEQVTESEAIALGFGPCGRCHP